MRSGTSRRTLPHRLARRVIVAVAWAVAVVPVQAEIPVTGCPVPRLAELDELVTNLVTSRNIPGATVAVMKDGVVVYERGFGYRDEARRIPMPPDAMMRVGSVSKPVTAAAVRKLVEDGRLRLNDFAFDLGQPRGGVLPHEPFPALGDERLKQITVDHLLHHRGGWNRNQVGDLTYMEIAVADAMGVPSPPGRDNTMRYILGQPLQFTPGAASSYANISYLVLGLIVEEVSGMDLMQFLHRRVLEPVGVDPAEYVLGRSFEADKHPREPHYHFPGYAPNVFDPDGPLVARPYGSYHHEARVGQGGHVTTARSLLHFLNNYHVNGPLIGARLTDPLPPGTVQYHGGATYGSEAVAVQLGGGINYAVTINEWKSSNSHATAFRNALNNYFTNAAIVWPTRPASQNCYSSADLNGDGVVNFFDLSMLIDALGPCDGCIDCFADLNNDCQVNFFDLVEMIDHFR